VWFEQASPASLTITVGRIGADDAPTAVTTFTGPGPDRTGLAFLGTLSATAHGAWLASQDHLFLLGASRSAAPGPPEPRQWRRP
jgi:hypothetical protein